MRQNDRDDARRRMSLRATVKKGEPREAVVEITPSVDNRVTGSSISSIRVKRSTHVLYELETGGDFSSIGLVLCAIYGGGSVDEFMHTLERSIRRYDRDIECMCSFHFRGFVEAVQELVTLRQECDDLNRDVARIDEQLSSAANDYKRRYEEIMHYRRLQRNIATAIDTISACMPLLEQFAHLQEHMQEMRYFQALELLIELENSIASQNKAFYYIDKLKAKFGRVREQIKEASINDFKSFLVNARNVSQEIGERVLNQVTNVNEMKRVKNHVAQTTMIHGSPQTKAAHIDKVGSELSMNESYDHELIDYSPVYKCLHTFTVLGEKATFEKQYREQRKEQAKVLMCAPSKMSVSLDEYTKFFHEAIGFFVIEDHVMHTTDGLVTRQHREQLWAIFSQEMSKVIAEHFYNCTDPLIMQRIERLVLLFTLALQSFGFPVAHLLRFLEDFSERYRQVAEATAERAVPKHPAVKYMTRRG